MSESASDNTFPTTDREPSSQELHDARAVLASAPIAYLAMRDAGSDDSRTSGDPVRERAGGRAAGPTGGPYVVPVNFVYDEEGGRGRIAIHTGEGRKSQALAIDPRVCLAIVADSSFDLGPEPCLDGFSYRSVVVEGDARLLETPAERETALRAIVAKYDPEAIDRPFDADTFERTLVYSITVESFSYKQRPTRP